MYCENCGAELPEGSEFCSNCGKRINPKDKNIYLALAMTFFVTGLGSIYAGNMKKGLVLLGLRSLFLIFAYFVQILFIFSLLVWAYGFYEAYRDVQIANGHNNPRLLNDFKGWNQNTKVIAVIIIFMVLIITVAGSVALVAVEYFSPGDTHTHSYLSDIGSGSSHSSHYRGVDDSPWTIARNDPDWYYDHYDYGDNDEIDEYLESQGYD